MDTPCNIARMDIVPLISLINMIVIHYGNASHTIFSQYEGDGYVPLKPQGVLEPTDGEQISCAFIGSSRVDIVWKWRGGSNSYEPDHYFDPPVSKIGSGDSQISSSHLIWKSGITDTEKRTASGIIYAEGTHQDDSGISTCDDVTLTILWKPEGTTSLSGYTNPLVFGENKTLQLRCQLTDKGNPEGQVRWIKNGNLQSESEYNSQTLSIHVTKNIDGDKWQCYYYNMAGDGKYSNDVMVNVHWEPEKPLFSINKDQLVFGEDSTAQLTCQLTDKGNPEGQVRWIKNGILQSESEYNTPTISIPVTRDINGDKWQCYYYNTAGSGVYSDDVIVKVHSGKPEKPLLSINKDPLVIGEDSMAQFTCQHTDKGNPEGQVRWIKNWNIQSGSEYNTHTIRIPVTKDIDGDNWQCYYYNKAGDGDYSDEVIVKVHWLPGGATISADNQTSKFGDTLTFTCTGDRGKPYGQVFWFLNTELVANTTNRQHTIAKLEELHSGMWSCMFDNYLNSGAKSQSIQMKIIYLPGVHIDYITYEFTSESVSFTLKIKDLFAAATLDVSVCSIGDYSSCNMGQQFNIENSSSIEQNVVLPENSDGEIYNVTFTFTDNYRIVTRHGIGLKGPVVQGKIPTILAILLGTLLIVAIVTIMALIYVFHRRNKATGIAIPRETSMHYMNVGSEGNSSDITHNQATQEYEDVNTAATTNGQSSNIGNPTYMDLDQNDILQTRNRPVDVTVYQSLN